MSFDNIETDLLTIFERRLDECPDRSLFTFLDRNCEIYESITYRQLFARATAISSILQSFHVAGRPVALIYPQGPQFIDAFYGTIFASAIPMPQAIPRGVDWRRLVSVLDASGAAIILTVHSIAEMIPKDILRIHRVNVICTDPVQMEIARHWTRPDISSQDIAFVQFTSGSTSSPKGVAITHANLFHNAKITHLRLALSSNDIGVSWLPFFHDMGLINHVIQPVYSEIHNFHLATAVFISRPARWLEAITRYRGTISGGPNFAFEWCCQKIVDTEELDLSAWRIAYCGSERICLETMSRFEESFAPVGFNGRAFYPCYGLAESTLFVTGTQRRESASLEPLGPTYTRVGDLADRDSIVIVDEHNGHCIESEKTVGEIWVRSASVASGYYRDSELSRVTFAGTCDRGTCYMRTGDLGFIYDGGLYFVGRLKNMLKIRGRSLYAEDVEALVMGATQSSVTARCAVFAVNEEVDRDLIVLIESNKEGDDIAQRKVSLVASQICEAFGVAPQLVRIVAKNSLPVTTSGKLRRSKCREFFLAGLYG